MTYRGLSMTVITVTQTQAAVRLGVTERTVRRRIASGALRTVPDTNGGRGSFVVLDIDGQPSETAPDGEIAALRELVDVLREQLRASQDREGAMLDTLRQTIALPPPKPRQWWKFWRFS